MHERTNSDGVSGISRSPWHKAHRCANSSCLEVSFRGENILLRDSKNPEGAVVTCTRPDWLAFVDGVKAGDFDDVADAEPSSRPQTSQPPAATGGCEHSLS
jgi:hypothetical protein